MRALWPIGLAALLAGCGLWGGNDAAVQVAVADDPALARTLAAEAASATLIRRDAGGAVVPGLASSWRFLDDGRTLIMRLRPARWPSRDEARELGRELAARDVLASLRQHRGALPAGLVLRAPIARVVEMRLPRAEPLLLEQLASPALAIGRGRQGFPGDYRSRREGNGWRLAWRDEDTSPPGATSIRLASQPAAAAVADFQAGRLDVVLGGGLNGLAEARGVGGAALKLEARWGLLGLVLARRGALADVRVRRALALMAPRAGLADAMALNVLQPQTRLVPGLPALPPPGAATAEAEARQLLQQAGSPARLPLRIAVPPGAAGARLQAVLAAAWAPLGVELAAAGNRRSADVTLVEWASPIPDAHGFLSRLTCRQGLVCVPAADALLASARTAPDPARRAALLAEAESRWRADAQLVPLANPIGWALVKGDIEGFQPNAGGVHPLWPLRRRG